MSKTCTVCLVPKTELSFRMVTGSTRRRTTCMSCDRATSREYYARHRKRLLEYRSKHDKMPSSKKRIQKSYLKATELLCDAYIKQVLRRKGKIALEHITPELIEFKREQLTLTRLLREVKHGVARARNIRVKRT